MRTRNRTTRRLKIIVPLVVALGALAFTPALADHRHHKKHGRHGHGHRGHHGQSHAKPHHRVKVHHGPAYSYRHAPYAHPRSFVVPRVIHRAHHETYRPYYDGRVYYEPHRHHHAVYHFPVAYRGGYVWKPHAYCNGELYTTRVAYHGPRVSFRIAF